MGSVIARVQQRVAPAGASHRSVRDAIAVARLAPSSHNSQPWAVASFESPEALRALAEWLGVRPRADERWLVLAVDAERALDALPSLATEMRLSCGMFLQLFAARVAEDGLAVRVVPCAGKLGIPPLAGYPGAWTPLAAVAVSSGAARTAVWDSGVASDRRTNRAPYDKRKVSETTRRALLGAEALFAPGDGRVSLQLFDDRALIERAGDFVGRNASIDFTDENAWRETYSYIRFGEHAAAVNVDGFALTQLFGSLPPGVPRLLQLALSPPAMRVLRRVGVPTFMAKGLGRLVGSAPLLACVSVDDAAPWTDVVAGGVAIDLWMRATAAGLALHPVSAILQHDELRVRFQELIAPRGRAVFFARLGYPTASFPPTLRRALEPGDPSSGWVRL